jgi:hypothetical protein
MIEAQACEWHPLALVEPMPRSKQTREQARSIEKTLRIPEYENSRYSGCLAVFRPDLPHGFCRPASRPSVSEIV